MNLTKKQMSTRSSVIGKAQTGTTLLSREENTTATNNKGTTVSHRTVPISNVSSSITSPTSNSNSRGYWQDDEEITECNDCSNEFTLLNRRHHCRICGLIYCDNCAPVTYDLPQPRYRGQRCCKKCYDSIVHPTPRRKGRPPPWDILSSLPPAPPTVASSSNDTDNDDNDDNEGEEERRKKNNKYNLQPRNMDKEFTKKKKMNTYRGNEPLSPLQLVAEEQYNRRRLIGNVSTNTTRITNDDNNDDEEDNTNSDNPIYSDSEATDTDEEDENEEDEDSHANVSSSYRPQRNGAQRIRFATSSVHRRLVHQQQRQQQQVQQNLDDMVTTMLHRLRKQAVALQTVHKDAELTKKENTVLRKVVRKHKQLRYPTSIFSDDGEYHNDKEYKNLPKPKPGNTLRLIPVSKEGIVDSASTREGYFGNMYTGFLRGRGGHACTPEVEATFTDGPTGLQLGPALPFMRLMSKALGIKDVALPTSSYIEIYGNAMETNNNNNTPEKTFPSSTTTGTTTNGKDKSGEKVLRSRYGVNVPSNEKNKMGSNGISTITNGNKGSVNYLDVNSLMNAVSAAVKVDYESLQYYTATDPSSALSAPAHPLPDLLIQAPYSLTIARIVSLPNGDPSPAQCLNNSAHHPCCEWLRPGLLLTHINGVHIAGIGPTRALDMFNRAVRPVSLRFLYHPLATIQLQHATVCASSQILRAQVDTLTDTLASAINLWTKSNTKHKTQLRTVSDAFLSQRETIKKLNQQIKENNTVIEQTKDEVKELRTRVDLLATLRGGETGKPGKGWSKVASLINAKPMTSSKNPHSESNGNSSALSITNESRTSIVPPTVPKKISEISLPPTIVRNRDLKVPSTTTPSTADPLYPSTKEDMDRNDEQTDGSNISTTVQEKANGTEFVFQGSEQQLLQQLMDASKTSKSISTVINTMVIKRRPQTTKLSLLQRRIGEVSTDVQNLTLVSALLQRDAAINASDVLQVREKELEAQTNQLRMELENSQQCLEKERQRVHFLETFIKSTGQEVPSTLSPSDPSTVNMNGSVKSDFTSLWNAFRSTTQQLTLLSAAYEKSNKEAEEYRGLVQSLERQCSILRARLYSNDDPESTVDDTDRGRENTNPFDNVIDSRFITNSSVPIRSKSIFPSLFSDTLNSIAPSVGKLVEDFVLQPTDTNSTEVVDRLKDTKDTFEIPLITNTINDMISSTTTIPTVISNLFLPPPDDLGDTESSVGIFVPPPNDTEPMNPSQSSVSGNPFVNSVSPPKPSDTTSGGGTLPDSTLSFPPVEVTTDVLKDMKLPFTLTSYDLSNARLSLNPKPVPSHLIAGEMYKRHATSGSTARVQGRGEGVVLCSYFYKCSKDNPKKSFSNWAWRFGTLGCGECIYYKSEFDSKPQGNFSLRTISSVTVPSGLKKSPPSTNTNQNPENYVLEITLGYGKVYLLALQTAEEFELWYRLLAAVMYTNRNDSASFNNNNNSNNNNIDYDNEEDNDTSIPTTVTGINRSSSTNPFVRSASFLKKTMLSTNRRDSEASLTVNSSSSLPPPPTPSTAAVVANSTGIILKKKNSTYQDTVIPEDNEDEINDRFDRGNIDE